MFIEIEKYSKLLDKYSKIRISSWCRKISLNTNNQEWKKNRNLHAICLLDMLINNRIEEPYSRLPPDGPLPILSKTLIKSKLSPKFWKQSKNIYDNNSFIPEEESQVNNTDKLINNIMEDNKRLTNVNTKNTKTKKNKANSNLKNKRAKTPSIKNNNYKNNNNQIIYNNNINNNYIKKYNIMKDNDNGNDIKNKYYNNINNEKNNYYINNNFANDENIYNNSNELDMLKEKVLKLEEELNKKEMIIEMQREERVKLTQKVDELENIFTSLISMNKF